MYISRRGGVCAIVNTYCCMYINAFVEMQIHIHRIWLQLASSEVPGPDWFSGLVSWIPQEIKSMYRIN